MNAGRPDTEVSWRRLVVVLAITQTMGFVAMVQVFPVVLVPIATELDVSRTAVTGAATVSTLCGAAAAMPIGRLLDRHGGRWVMTLGSLLGAVAVLLWSQAQSLTQLYLAFVLIGLGLAMSSYEATFAVLVVATELPDRDRSILTVTMIAGLFTYLFFPVLGWLEAALGWRQTLVVMAVALVVTSAPTHLWAIPNRAVHVRRVQRRTSVSIRVALRQRRFWLLALAFVSQAAATSTVLLLLVAYLRDIGHTAAAATTIPLAIGLLQILSRLALTTFAKRLPLVRAAVLAFATQGLGLVLLPLVGLSLPLTFLCVAAIGLGNGVSVIARPSIVADAFGTAQFASIMSAITVPTALARAGAPLGGAWLGDWRFLALAGAASFIGALALVPLARGGSRADPTPPVVQGTLDEITPEARAP